ncbi:MAG: hypothetical protein D6719_09710 [Candidatus Dadabacteria bacterium]|nr:MAG: hypothetical protein D6719_09710 [Candidatus Dadabacteria bacterium]
MKAALALINIAFVAVTLLIALMAGRNSVCFVARVAGFSKKGSYKLAASLPISVVFIAGLVVELVSVFFLKQAGAGWLLALLPAVSIALLDLRGFRRSVARYRPELSLNFVAWFAVILGTGISLFETTNGIHTPWRNNYGDLTFHIGMITSFVFGDNFPVEYHLFAGERLSYPFLINLWSALLWWISPSFYMLSLIFMLQWLILWLVVFFLLNGNRFWLLPWALFFGGGSIIHLGADSHQLIPQNVPWTVFLTTVWVTQRAALFGTAVILAALTVIYPVLIGKATMSRPEKYFRIAFSGLLLALSPLAHTHIVSVGIFYIVLTLFLAECLRPGFIYRQESFKTVILFILVLVPSFIFLPWLIGKAHMIKFIYGWTTGLSPARPFWQSVSDSYLMWIKHVHWWGIAVLLFWVLSDRHRLLIPLAVLFVTANFVQLAVWDWDQLKVFIALYIIFLFIWSREEKLKFKLLQVCCIGLMFPALWHVYFIFKKGENYEVYSKEQLEMASIIRAITPKHAIFAARPDHNTLITLTGRRLFLGYEGTLASHGLNYINRKKIMMNLDALANCRQLKIYPDVSPSVCPDFLLWTSREVDLWRVNEPKEGFEKLAYPFIYRIKGSR